MAVSKAEFLRMNEVLKELVTILENHAMPGLEPDKILPKPDFLRSVKNIRDIVTIFESSVFIEDDPVEDDEGPEDLKDDWPHAILERLETASATLTIL